MTDFPHTHMDRRPRKRARLGWDVPEAPEVIDPFSQIGDLSPFLRFLDLCFAGSERSA